MSYLFVNEKGAVISLADNTIKVTYRDGLIKTIPIETLDAIYIFTYAQITTQCTIECLMRGIRLSYFSPTGKYFGRLQSTDYVNVPRQRRQVKLYESDFSLELAKRIIKGKIHNQEIIVRRYSRSANMNWDMVFEYKNQLLRHF